MVNMKQQHKLKDGLSGIMRMRNEAQFVADCIDSCIEALDELVIVYNDCTDNTPIIVEAKRKQYPDKIKVYPYSYHVLSTHLTKTELEYVMSLPEDSPLLFSSLCNFILSKVSYKYAMLIDADQLYFADEIKNWRDVCAKQVKVRWSPSLLFGWGFMIYISLYRRISAIMNRPCLFMIPKGIMRLFVSPYHNYAKYLLLKKKASIALSGLNVFKDTDWYVLFDGINVHPPYNGAGDHVIFPLTDQTYFCRRKDEQSKQSTYAVMESFHCPYKMFFAGIFWFHLHANRPYCWEKEKKMKENHPEMFVPLSAFLTMSYKKVHEKMDKVAHPLFQRVFFSIVHEMGVNNIGKYVRLLNKRDKAV